MDIDIGDIGEDDIGNFDLDDLGLDDFDSAYEDKPLKIGIKKSEISLILEYEDLSTSDHRYKIIKLKPFISSIISQKMDSSQDIVNEIVKTLLIKEEIFKKLDRNKYLDPLLLKLVDFGKEEIDKDAKTSKTSSSSSFLNDSVVKGDLNTLSDKELSQAKEKMSVGYFYNLVTKGDKEYEYDKQIDFNQETAEDSGWD